jgi:integrase
MQWTLKIKHADLREGALWITQNKTGVKRAIEITGELKALIDRINQSGHACGTVPS